MPLYRHIRDKDDLLDEVGGRSVEAARRVSVPDPGSRLRRQGDGPDGQAEQRRVVLAERIAGTLVNHEPGWRLPRISEIARRHNVSAGEVRAAIDELTQRQLIRQSPDGHLYRATPAGYLIAVDGLDGLAASVDPHGRDLTCLGYGASRQPAPEAAAIALRVHAGEPVGVLRMSWAIDGQPAAVSTTYLARHPERSDALAARLAAVAASGSLPLTLPPGGRDLPWPPGGETDARTPGWQQRTPGSSQAASCQLDWSRTVSVRMELPPVSVARRLRLRPGQLAVMVIVLVGADRSHLPAALTATVLRPDMFSVTIATPATAPGAAWPDPGWPLAAGDYPL